MNAINGFGKAVLGIGAEPVLFLGCGGLAAAQIVGTPVASGIDVLEGRPGRALDNLKGLPGRLDRLGQSTDKLMLDSLHMASSGLGEMEATGKSFLGESLDKAPRNRN